VLQSGVTGYLTAVAHRVDEALERAPLVPDQRALLAQSVARARARGEQEPLGDPLSVIYLLVSAHGRPLERLAEHVGAFALLYILSLDLFDDVQDEDVAGTPYEHVPPAIALNCAIALGFLALDELRHALELEPDRTRCLAYLELYNRTSLLAVSGQHRDLSGLKGDVSPEQVLDSHAAKTSSMAMFVECGALLAGAADTELYRRLGRHLATFIQIVDDLRDIFGKPHSPDLASGKVTFPVACFHQHADAASVAELSRLVGELPGSTARIRALLYEQGTVERVAATLEEQREAIHRDVMAIGTNHAALRTLLDVVDSLAARVYEPPALECSAPLWRPSGGWHDRVHDALATVVSRAQSYGLAAPPDFVPWHLPHYMFFADKGVVRYPDVEGLAADILPFQAMLLGEDDLAVVAKAMEAQVPAVVAHEMFHFWRHTSGRLTEDHWHEEWVANRLAVAYLREHEPRVLASTLDLAERVLGRFSAVLDEPAERVLAECHQHQPERHGYNMPALTVAVVTLEMIRRLALETPTWQSVMSDLLAPAPAGG
jgi:geranylgeranyl pyrophosphate synthase